MTPTHTFTVIRVISKQLPQLTHKLKGTRSLFYLSAFSVTHHASQGSKAGCSFELNCSCLGSTAQLRLRRRPCLTRERQAFSTLKLVSVSKKERTPGGQNKENIPNWKHDASRKLSGRKGARTRKLQCLQAELVPTATATSPLSHTGWVAATKRRHTHLCRVRKPCFY